MNFELTQLLTGEISRPELFLTKNPKKSSDVNFSSSIYSFVKRGKYIGISSDVNTNRIQPRSISCIEMSLISLGS